MTNTKIVPAKLQLAPALERLHAITQQRVKGGWFSSLKIAKVQVAYLYGDDVTDSDDWERYISSGELKAIQIEVPYLDNMTPILVSRDCVVVFYANLSEYKYLNYATEIFGLLEDIMT